MTHLNLTRFFYKQKPIFPRFFFKANRSGTRNSICTKTTNISKSSTIAFMEQPRSILGRISRVSLYFLSILNSVPTKLAFSTNIWHFCSDSSNSRHRHFRTKHRHIKPTYLPWCKWGFMRAVREVGHAN